MKLRVERIGNYAFNLFVNSKKYKTPINVLACGAMVALADKQDAMFILGDRDFDVDSEKLNEWAELFEYLKEQDGIKK